MNIFCQALLSECLHASVSFLYVSSFCVCLHILFPFCVCLLSLRVSFESFISVSVSWTKNYQSADVRSTKKDDRRWMFCG